MRLHNQVPFEKMTPFSAAVLRQRLHALSGDRMSATGWLLGLGWQIFGVDFMERLLTGLF
jgi:hypothetical protein